jgi:AcrR family transcriptional regulator
MEAFVEDRRVRRTRERLQQALVALILEKGYDRITVQDLIDRADVGRSTFYAHYETKDDLMRAGLGKLTALLEQSLREGSEESVLPVRALFAHLDSHHSLYKAMLRERGLSLVEDAVVDILTRFATEAIAADPGGRRPGVDPDVHAAYLAGSLMAFLDWWLDHDRPHSVDRMDEMFRLLSTSALPGA